MQIGALYQTIGAGCALGSAIDGQPWTVAARTRCDPKVNFIALHGIACLDVGGAGQGDTFFLRHDCGDVEKAEAGDCYCGALNPVWITDLLAKHLISCADSEDAAAAAHMGCEVDVPPLGAEESEVGDGGFGARDQDEVCIEGQGATLLDDLYADAGFGGEGIEVVEIHDAAEAGDGDFVGAACVGSDVHDVFCWEAPCIWEPWDHTEGGPSGEAGDGGQSIVEEAGVAAEFVDTEGFDVGCILLRQNGLSADDLRDDAAAVDVAAKDNGHASGIREAHIGDVARAQIDFGRAAGTLDDDEIGSGCEAVEAFEDGAHEFGFGFGVVAGTQGVPAFALHDDLRAGVCLWFEQNGVHVGVRFAPRGEGLERLGTADFAAIARDGSIV